jgi:hypothetical protein
MSSNSLKVKISGPKVQEYIKTLGLLPKGKVQTFIDSEIVRLADSFVPSDTTATRKSVFINPDFGSGKIIYSIYGDPNGRNTYNDTTSKFQGAPKRGPFWVHRMLDAGGREKVMLGIRRLLGGK